MRYEPHQSRNSFTSFDCQTRITSPVYRIDSSTHIHMKAWIGPIPDPIYPAMLNRIPVNVIDAPFKIKVVTYQMFPISTLPDATLTSLCPAHGSSFTWRDGTRKPSLNQCPSCLIVRITWWQCPNAMQVIGENDYRIDVKRMIVLDLAKASPKYIEIIR